MLLLTARSLNVGKAPHPRGMNSAIDVIMQLLDFWIGLRHWLGSRLVLGAGGMPGFPLHGFALISKAVRSAVGGAKVGEPGALATDPCGGGASGSHLFSPALIFSFRCERAHRELEITRRTW